MSNTNTGDKFPQNYIRGITSKTHIDAQDKLKNDAFSLKPSLLHYGYNEASINWEDSSDVKAFSLNQKKASGENMFEEGIAILRTDILNLCEKCHGSDVIFHSRDILPDNPYHGNILIKDNLDRVKKVMILNQILLGSEVIRRK